MRTSELPSLASYFTQDDSPEIMEKTRSLHISPRRWRAVFCALATMFLMVSFVSAEECKMGSDLDAATKTALDNTAQKYYQMAASGDLSSLQQNSIPSVASSFSGIQSAINEHKADFGPSSTVRSTYELDAPGTATITRAEFFCGIFNSSDRVAFAIPNLPPGRYGLVILDAQGGKQPMTVSTVLQQYASGAWKLAGFYARPSSLAGHDADWYLNQARSFKAKGQDLAAWMYYLAAWDLHAPVPFMSTSKLDKISEEAQSAKPADLPTDDQPMKLTSADGKTYEVTSLFAVPVQDGLGLVVKYKVPDISNTAQTYQTNVGLMKDLLAKYPELRDAFTSIVARAVAPSGHDYGTLLAMKDVK